MRVSGKSEMIGMWSLYSRALFRFCRENEGVRRAVGEGYTPHGMAF